MMWCSWWPFSIIRGCPVPFIRKIMPDCTLLSSANIHCKEYRCFPGHQSLLISHYHKHIWDATAQHLLNLPVLRSEDKLWQMVDRDWRAIPQDSIHTLIDSVPKHVASCIIVHCDPTSYWTNAVLTLYYEYIFKIKITYCSLLCFSA